MDIVALVLWIIHGILRRGIRAYQLLNTYAEDVPLLLKHWLFSIPADIFWLIATVCAIVYACKERKGQPFRHKRWCLGIGLACAVLVLTSVFLPGVLNDHRMGEQAQEKILASLIDEDFLAQKSATVSASPPEDAALRSFGVGDRLALYTSVYEMSVPNVAEEGKVPVWYNLGFVENCPAPIADRVWNVYCEEVQSTSRMAGFEAVPGETHRRVAMPEAIGDDMEYIVSFRDTATDLAPTPYAALAVRRGNTMLYFYVSVYDRDADSAINSAVVIENALAYMRGL